MKINKLILSGYKRLMLNNISKITITPESPVQLILGTNGSGKSSVLYELSPLPAHHTNYQKGGYKQIELEHRGSSYVLTSAFKNVKKHNFVKDNEELNPGGTTNVQLELVMQNFGITKEVHELLIGEVEFTHLSPSKRREWITKLSDVDFTYALDVYKKLKTAARDSQGAVKHVKGRLVAETNKLLAVGDLEALEDRYNALHSDINLIFENRSNDSGNLTLIKSEIDSKLMELETLSKTLIRQFPYNETQSDYTSVDDIDVKLNELKSDRGITLGTKTQMTNELLELRDTIGEYTAEGIDNLDQLKEKVTVLSRDLLDYKNNLEYWKVFGDRPQAARRSLFEIKDSLIEILTSIEDNTDFKYNRQKLIESRELNVLAKTELEKNRNKCAYYENKLEHLSSLKEQTCPKCKFEWIPGKSDKEEAQLIEAISSINLGIKELVEKTETLSMYIENAEEYSRQFTQLKQLINQSTILKDFWSLVLEEGLLHNSPRAVVPLIFTLERDLNTLSKIAELETTLEHLNALLSTDSTNEHLARVKARIISLEIQIEKEIKVIESLDRELHKVTRHKSKVISYQANVERMESLLIELTTLRDDSVKSLKDQLLNNALRESQTTLAFLEAKKSEKSSLEGIIGDLETDKGSLEQTFKSLTDVSKELSPVDGLIAEQLKGFINNLVNNVNQVIEKIWSYDLKVLPCSTASGDLDYKFPLLVKHEGDSNHTPDISKGSEAQVEVVNFAFRLVIMHYLGLEEYPIYLDEFSASFDEQHRINALNFIKQLIDSSNHSQLFLISHYASQFGGFASAEILVLDSTNISIPQKHNTHVTIQ